MGRIKKLFKLGEHVDYDDVTTHINPKYSLTLENVSIEFDHNITTDEMVLIKATSEETKRRLADAASSKTYMAIYREYVRVIESMGGRVVHWSPPLHEYKQEEKQEDGEEEPVAEESKLRRLKRYPAPDKPRQRVKCPDHDVWMHYIPAEDIYKCTVDTCDLAVRRRITFKDHFVDGDAPNVYRGELDLVEDEQGNVYMHLKDWNGLVDVTAYIEDGKKALLDADPKVSSLLRGTGAVRVSTLLIGAGASHASGSLPIPSSLPAAHSSLTGRTVHDVSHNAFMREVAEIRATFGMGRKFRA